jgi:hypothetical protein
MSGPCLGIGGRLLAEQFRISSSVGTPYLDFMVSQLVFVGTHVI